MPDPEADDPNGPPYVLEDFESVTGVFDEDTCLTITFIHDKEAYGSCDEAFILNAYSGAYNETNKNQNFLGYGDYYWTDSYSVTVPAGSALHLVSESFWTNGNLTGDPCYMEVLIDDQDGNCSK